MPEWNFSHILGTAKNTDGDTSRIFSGTVSRFSAKLMMEPTDKGQRAEKERSAIWMSGRKDNCSSLEPSGNRFRVQTICARQLRCEIIAPLGGPVVPDV